MLEFATKGTIQEMALNIIEEKLKTQQTNKNVGKERTIFVLGSKGAGKSTIINSFLDRDEQPKPTLALEFSFGRRSGSGQDIQKHVCNVWELGSLSKLNNLIDIPIKSHGLDNLHIVIVLDLSQPDRLWIDLESALDGLKQSFLKTNANEINRLKDLMGKLIGKQHSDLDTLDIFPVPVLIVGGNYDKFQDFDPEIKKHVCRYLRSISHTIGAALIFYSSKHSSLAKTVRETFNHFGFGMPSNPFRTLTTDYNGPLIIWYGQDSWKNIGVTPSNSERIGLTYSAQIPQIKVPNKNADSLDSDETILDPAKDTDFREIIIDEMRAQKDEELLRLIKETEIRAKFQQIAI